MNQAPVLSPSGPFLRNIHHGQIQHFQQTVIGRKYRFCLGHLAQLAVKALNGVGGVDQSSYLLRVFEICAQIGLIGPPGLGNFRVFLVPVHSKGVQGSQGSLLIHGSIDRLQVLVGHILAGIAQLVDDAVLNFDLWEGGVDGIQKNHGVDGFQGALLPA